MSPPLEVRQVAEHFGAAESRPLVVHPGRELADPLPQVRKALEPWIQAKGHPASTGRWETVPDRFDGSHRPRGVSLAASAPDRSPSTEVLRSALGAALGDLSGPLRRLLIGRDTYGDILRGLDADAFEKSFRHPVQLAENPAISLVNGSLYAKRQDRFQKIDGVIDWPRHAKGQPWLEWRPEQRTFLFHQTGGTESLRATLGRRILYRGTPELGGHLMELAKLASDGKLTPARAREARQVLKKVNGLWHLPSAKRRQLSHWDARLSHGALTPKAQSQLTDFLLSLVHAPSSSRAMGAIYAAAARPAWLAGPGKRQQDQARPADPRAARNTVLTFDVDFDSMPEDVKAGVYAGVEHLATYVELAFFTPAAKRYLLDRLRRIDWPR